MLVKKIYKISTLPGIIARWQQDSKYYEDERSNRTVFFSVPLGLQEFLPDCHPSPVTDSGLSLSSTSSSISLGTGGTALSHLSPTLLSEVDATAEQNEKVKALIEFITSR